MCTKLWITGGAALLLTAHPLYATFTTYQGDAPQEAAWQAAVGVSIPIEDFESFTGVGGPGSGSSTLSSLPSVHDTYDAPYPGVYADPQWAHSGTNQWNSWGNDVINSADHIMRPESGLAIYALGFWNCDPQGSQPMLAYDSNDQLVGSILGLFNNHNSDPANSTGFAGFISDVPIAYIVIPGNFGDGWNHFDDLQILTDNLTVYSLADFNQDGYVDGADFSFFLGQWGATGGLGDADFNTDNTVDGADFSFFLGEWNPAPPPDIDFIPEPASITLLTVCGLSLLRRRR